MAAPPPPPPPRGGLSLYDNLTDPNDPKPNPGATISSAPVIYNQNDASAEAASKKPLDPSLRFQPIRRPQVKQPTKPKPSFPKVGASKPASTTQTTQTITENAPAKATAADWAATEEDEWLYGVGDKRHERGGRRKKKKKKKQEVQAETDWNEIYDPARPTNIDEYLRSDEKVDEVREWKGLLHRHRRSAESDISDDEEDARPSMTSMFLLFVQGSLMLKRSTDQFAPPPSFNAFAPPPPSPPSVPPPDEDPYVHRQALTDAQFVPAPPPSDNIPPPPPQDPIAHHPTDPSTISAAPVRYAQPSPPPPPPPAESPPLPEEPSERSSRPGQAGFASRLMQKYGWTAGKGLGASSEGIVNPLRVQVEKRRKKADADGGGWAEPGGKGKIIGGRRADGVNDGGKFGAMSQVIVLGNMLDNMSDLQGEMEDGLGQEIGEECGEKVR